MGVEEKRRKMKMEKKKGIGGIGVIGVMVSWCIGRGMFGMRNGVGGGGGGGGGVVGWVLVGFGFLMVVFGVKKVWEKGGKVEGGML